MAFDYTSVVFYYKSCHNSIRLQLNSFCMIFFPHKARSQLHQESLLLLPWTPTPVPMETSFCLVVGVYRTLVGGALQHGNKKTTKRPISQVILNLHLSINVRRTLQIGMNNNKLSFIIN